MKLWEMLTKPRGPFADDVSKLRALEQKLKSNDAAEQDQAGVEIRKIWNRNLWVICGIGVLVFYRLQVGEWPFLDAIYKLRFGNWRFLE